MNNSKRNKEDEQMSNESILSGLGASLRRLGVSAEEAGNIVMKAQRESNAKIEQAIMTARRNEGALTLREHIAKVAKENPRKTLAQIQNLVALERGVVAAGTDCKGRGYELLPPARTTLTPEERELQADAQARVRQRLDEVPRFGVADQRTRVAVHTLLRADHSHAEAVCGQPWQRLRKISEGSPVPKDVLDKVVAAIEEHRRAPAEARKLSVRDHMANARVRHPRATFTELQNICASERGVTMRLKMTRGS